MMDQAIATRVTKIYKLQIFISLCIFLKKLEEVREFLLVQLLNQLVHILGFLLCLQDFS